MTYNETMSGGLLLSGSAYSTYRKMTLDLRLAARLSGDSDLALLVDDRIFPAPGEQDTEELPYLNYVKTDTSYPSRHLNGLGSLRFKTFLLEFYAEHKAEIDAVETAVLSCLDGWRDLSKGVQLCQAETVDVQPEDQKYHGTIAVQIIGQEA
jgi:hypothetical protein